MVVRSQRRWIARPEVKSALFEVVWMATAFTVAHSITLGRASFHIVSIPACVKRQLAVALFGFNFGVEIGQLSFIARLRCSDLRARSDVAVIRAARDLELSYAGDSWLALCLRPE